MTKTQTKRTKAEIAIDAADEREAKAIFGLMAIADQLEVLATAQKKMAQCVRLVGADWTDVAEIQRMSNELAEAVRLATLWNEQMPDIEPDETYPVTTSDGRTVRCTVPPSNNE